MTIERKTTSSKRRTRSNRRSRRGGYVLVLVALLLFGLMAMAALVIDIGFARLAQRQMQTATDAAALEGLRFRDVETDVARRERASTIVANIFDDDLVLTADVRNFGAGPIVNFDDRVPGGDGVYANEFIHSDDNPSPNYPEIGSLPLVPVYKPWLNTNIGNEIEGDMVAGSSYDPTQVHTEQADYSRADFVPSSPANPANDVFLVRMRRTGEFSNSSLAPQPSGTSGPTLPYLFGRGSLINRQLIGEGIRIRATSIAAAQPVISVGEVGPAILGKLGIAISKDQWITPPVAPLTPTFYEATLGIVGEVIGANSLSPTKAPGYIAIFSTVANNRVVGFGYASVTNGTLTRLRFGTSTTQIAYENVSATFTRAVSMPPAELETVFTERRLLQDQNQLLLAPVLVR